MRRGGRQHLSAWALLCLTVALTAVAAGVAHEGVPLPTLYSGKVTVQGANVPDGLRLVAAIGEYESLPVLVKEGRYSGLTVGPPNASYEGQTIHFFLASDLERVRAAETDTFQAGGTPQLKILALAFPRAPRLSEEAPATGESDAVKVAWLLGVGIAVVVVAAIAFVYRRSFGRALTRR